MKTQKRFWQHTCIGCLNPIVGFAGVRHYEDWGITHYHRDCSLVLNRKTAREMECGSVKLWFAFATPTMPTVEQRNAAAKERSHWNARNAC